MREMEGQRLWKQKRGGGIGRGSKRTRFRAHEDMRGEKGGVAQSKGNVGYAQGKGQYVCGGKVGSERERERVRREKESEKERGMREERERKREKVCVC